MTSPESAEDFHARIAAATDEEGRLPVRMEAMPGWDIFPFELDSLRVKPLQPLADAEPERMGEDPATCSCRQPSPPEVEARIVWSNERWRLTTDSEVRLPVFMMLRPHHHCDLTDVPDDLAEEMGRVIVAVSAAIETLPSVARAQLAKYGDGGAHLHLFFFGRPARMLQFRGSPLLDWEENLPALPDDVRLANAGHVGRLLVERLGGEGPAWA